MQILLTKHGKEEKKISATLKKLIVDIQNHDYLDCQDDIREIRCSINLIIPGPENEKKRKEIFTILDDLQWDTWHHFNVDFRERSMIPHAHKLYNLLKMPETEGTLKERLFLLRTRIFNSFYSLCNDSDEDMKTTLMLQSQEFHGFAEEVTTHKNKNVYKTYQVAHADFARALSFLPVLRQSKGTTKDGGEKTIPYPKEDVKKIQDEFAPFLQSIDNLITELDAPVVATSELSPEVIKVADYVKEDEIEDVKEAALKAKCWDKLANKSMGLNQIAESEHITIEYLKKLLFPQGV